jgi:hypothetical protein
MFREIIIPTETRQTIEFPEDFVGKPVEIIAFTIDDKEKKQFDSEEAFKFWEEHRVDMSNFKFDRFEANER